MLFKFSNLNSNLALTLGYLNPDLNNSAQSELIKKTIKLELGISDHKLIYGCLQTKFRRPPPQFVQGRTLKRFNQLKFIRGMENVPWSVCSVFDDPDDSYWHG